MAQIKKHAEFLDALHTMVTKEANAGTATGKPGADTHYTEVSKETEKVDKNKEGHPEHNPQEFKQEKAHDASDPTKTHKAAEEAAPTPELDKEAKAKKEVAVPMLPDTKPAEAAKIEAPTTVTQHEAKKVAEEKVEEKPVEKTATNEKLAQLGNQLLEAINEINKQATAGKATGKPGADTHYTEVSKETEKVDKNKEGHPEHNPQEFKQEKAKDESDPTKTHKAAEATELDKEASFELGRQFARAFLSTKTATEANIYKEAGRRDFEALIAQAAAELEQEDVMKPKVVKQAAAPQVDEELQIKQAEEAGAQAFHAMLKQAQDEEQANQVKLAIEQHINKLTIEKTAAETKANELAAKLAEKDAAIEKQAEEAKLDAKFAQWGGRVVEEVISRLKQTPA